jgi:hypothetical protein
MNEGARQANDQARHLSESAERSAILAMLREIRDILRRIELDEPAHVIREPTNE